jgi:hypothetical protein
MKQTILGIIIVLLLAFQCFADVFVSGYQRQDGTYVQPHYRSSPNSTQLDNFSTRGNVNPYTGQYGYRTPDYNTSNPIYQPNQVQYQGQYNKYKAFR